MLHLLWRINVLTTCQLWQHSRQHHFDVLGPGTSTSQASTSTMSAEKTCKSKQGTGPEEDADTWFMVVETGKKKR